MFGTEFKNLATRDTWHRVNFDKEFQVPPVVVLGVLEFNGPNESTVAIRNVDALGFEWQIEEWLYHDGPHTTEHVSWLAC